VDSNKIQETIAENEKMLRNLEGQIEQEEKKLNFDKAKQDVKNLVSSLEKKFKECEAQTNNQANNTLFNILNEVINIQSNIQKSEAKLKEKDEIIAKLTTQLENQSRSLNITKKQEAEIAEYKNQIQNNNIDIINLQSDKINAMIKHKDYDCKIKSLESNISLYKSMIDNKNAEILRLESTIKQSKIKVKVHVT